MVNVSAQAGVLYQTGFCLLWTGSQLSPVLYQVKVKTPGAQGYTVAIRMMLKDDGSASMMLFFGFVGALNAVCLAPVLLGMQLAGRVDMLGLSAHVLLLTVCKGVGP